MAAGHVITSGGGLRAGDLTGINNVRVDQTWTYPTVIDSSVASNGFASSDLVFSNTGADIGRILAGTAIFDPSGGFVGSSSMNSWRNMWNGGIIGLGNGGETTGGSGVLRRENRNGALISNTGFLYNYTGYKLWTYIHDIDPLTGNIVFAFWQGSSLSVNFNIIAFNGSGTKISDFVVGAPPSVAGVAISNDAIYVATLTSTAVNSGGSVYRFNFGGGVVWTRSDIPTYRPNDLNSGGIGPSGGLSTSFDGKVLYVIKKSPLRGVARAGEICALDASSGSRVGGGHVALPNRVRFTSKNADNTFCMNTSDSATSAAARFNKNAELLELSPLNSGGYPNSGAGSIIRANEKVLYLNGQNGSYINTIIQYPTVLSQWQILE